MLGRRHRRGHQPLQVEVLQELVDRTMRVGDQADLELPRGQLAQHRLGIVVEMKVVAGGPLHVHLAGAGVHTIAGPAHALDDAAGIADEDLVVVDHLLVIERRQRGADGRVVARLVHGDAVPLARLPVAHALERRARVNQGEVDVEEHGPVAGAIQSIIEPAIQSMPMPDWKDTVNLPRTGFPMKANLQTAEPEALARWQAAGLQQKLEERRRGAPKFVLHDGPPYANGQIHLGTALNKILKDLVDQVALDGRLRRALRAGLRLPRAAHRAAGRSRARRRRRRT